MNPQTRRPSINEIHEARRLVRDLRTPNPWIYWADLTITSAIAWTTLLISGLGHGVLHVAVCSVIAGLALTRGFLFVHEISHLRAGSLPGFRLAWNMVLGVPMLAPSFVYETVHLDHHKVNVYRTQGDPEHPPDDKTLLSRCAAAVLTAVIAPCFFFFRWSLLTPISLLHPALRRFVLDRVSSLTTNPNYRATPMSALARREARIAEAACFGWTSFVLIAIARGWIPASTLITAAIALSIATAITDLRGEILHRFKQEGSWGTLERQLRDSVNVPHTGPLSWLVLPVGIGYHALHHLDVSLPYHAMPKAHARLMKMLPPDSLYRRATSSSVWGATGQAIDHDADARARDSLVSA